MAYTKQTWTNGDAGGTPLSAARLSYMEDGIEDASDRLDTAEANITTNTGDISSLDGRTTVVESDISELQSAVLNFNQQTGTTYTLVLGDAAKLVEVSNASAITLTVPTNASVAFPVGTQLHLLQTGAGKITVAGSGGVTVNCSQTNKRTRAQWASATLIKRATDTWVLVGDLE